MKKNKIFSIVSIVVILLSFGNFIFGSEDPLVNTYLEKITPYPVEPGQDFTLHLRTYNEGDDLADNVKVKVKYGNEFFLKGKENNFDKPFELCVDCSKDNTYYFLVSTDTKSGEYPIIVDTYEGGAKKENKVFIRVIGIPDIIFKAKVLTQNVVADSYFDVKISVLNLGTGIAKDIKIQPVTDGFVMNGENILYINSLKPDHYFNKTIRFMTSDLLNKNPYKIKFKISYKDEKSQEKYFEQEFGVKVIDKVKLDISSVKIDPDKVFEGDSTKIIIRVENLGEGTAKNIRLFLTDEKEKLEDIKSYIGKLEENEDAPAVFTYTFSNFGQHNLKLKILYEDDLGTHEVNDEFSIYVNKKNNTIYFLIGGFIFVILIICLYYFMFNKKDK